MKKNKAKRKAIHAEVRKESKTFDGWMKYEITVKNVDGTIEKIPAYGKDLQDALSRVVHDEKVLKIENKVNRVPLFVWPFVWFTTIGLVTVQVLEHGDVLGAWTGLIYIGSTLVLTALTLGITNWFKLRNTENPN